MTYETQCAQAWPNDCLKEKVSKSINFRFARTFERELNKKELKYRYQQISLMEYLYQDIYNQQIPDNVIINIFDIWPLQLERERKYALEQFPKIGGILKLTTEQENNIILYIKDCFYNYHPLKASEILLYANKTYEKKLTDGWFQCFIKRHSEIIQFNNILPMDEARTHVNLEAINQYIQIMESTIEDIPSELIISVDETSNSKRINNKPYSGVVPTEYSGMPCYYKHESTQKNITSIVAITLTGDILIPGIILPSLTIPMLLDKSGIRDGIDASFYTSETGYVNSEIFYEYISSNFIPYINSKKKFLNMQNAKSLLLIDNCSAHTSDKLKCLLAINNIILITFPPHTSHLLAPLDLVFFGVYKKQKSNMSLFTDCPTIIERIDSIINVIYSTATPGNIRASYYRAGIIQNFNFFPSRGCMNSNIILENITNTIHLNVYQLQNEKIEGKKRRKALFGLVNQRQIDDIRNNICPFCHRAMNSDQCGTSLINEEEELNEEKE